MAPIPKPVNAEGQRKCICGCNRWFKVNLLRNPDKLWFTTKCRDKFYRKIKERGLLEPDIWDKCEVCKGTIKRYMMIPHTKVNRTCSRACVNALVLISKNTKKINTEFKKKHPVTPPPGWDKLDHCRRHEPFGGVWCATYERTNGIGCYKGPDCFVEPKSKSYESRPAINGTGQFLNYSGRI